MYYPNYQTISDRRESHDYHTIAIAVAVAGRWTAASCHNDSRAPSFVQHETLQLRFGKDP